MEKKMVRYTEEELKKMKGRTNWAKLIHEEEKESANKKIQPTQKTRG